MRLQKGLSSGYCAENTGSMLCCLSLQQLCDASLGLQGQSVQSMSPVPVGNVLNEPNLQPQTGSESLRLAADCKASGWCAEPAVKQAACHMYLLLLQLYQWPSLVQVMGCSPFELLRVLVIAVQHARLM